MRTMINCPTMCAKAANILREIGLNHFFGRCIASHRAHKLSNAPLKLNTNVGDKNCPNSKLLANTRNMLTHAAVAKPYWCSTYKVTILAMPGFTPGNGDGITASTMCNAIAIAASLAIRWSSSVV